MKTRKITETKTYTTGDIGINVRIDYYDNNISIVDHDGESKKFVFANRGVEYMNGWLNILEAMKVAIKEAKREYEHELAETSKFKDEEIKSLVKAGVLEARKKK